MRQWVRQKLFTALITYFDAAELETLCFELGVDYDSLAGEEKESKARELITWLERHGDVMILVEAIRRRRPRLELDLQPEYPTPA